MIYLDTHVVAWLFAGEFKRLSPSAEELIRENDLLISPIVSLELEYLREIGRTRVSGSTVVSTLQRDIGLRVCDRPFAEIVNQAAALAWTRDPFDRIIVGQAALQNDVLISKDETIRTHYNQTVW